MKFAFLERSPWVPCGKYIAGDAGDTGQELKVVWSSTEAVRMREINGFKK